MVNKIPNISAKNFIELSENELIGSGNKRFCYKHPYEPSLCIKVARKTTTWHENVIEWVYISHLKKQDISLTHLIDCHYWINTNYGPGLVFERVMDDDGNPSPTLAEAIKGRKIDISDVSPMLKNLKDWAINNSIVVAELNSVNMMVQKKDGVYKLVMVDGVGGRDRITWKFYAYQKSKIFSRMKTRKQIKRLEPVLFDEIKEL